ncbi:MAG TPA: AAA family ATPase [Nitrososphaerales archaeon]|nr:AAA family ATPase [Nitrososphaerales archaeon]
MKSKGTAKKKSTLFRIGITGSPGTGKRSVAEALSRFTGLKTIFVGEVAIQEGYGIWRSGEFIVNTRKLKGKIPTMGRIVCGHLLSDVVPPEDLDFVAILRCSPEELRRRYSRRGYSRHKMRENIEAELLDLVSHKALATYGREKVSEFDTSGAKDPSIVAKRILRTIQRKLPSQFGNVVDWAARASRSRDSLEHVLEGE